MENSNEKHEATDNNGITSGKPKIPLVFISHDTRDAELAEHFSKLLSSVSAGVLKSFRSSDKKGSQGIEYGVEWYPEIMRKLDDASDVVCLLTQRSVERPWILYEAGVAKGKLNTALLGISLGIPLSKVNSGPFAQFQNCADDEGSLSKLVMQLVNRIPNAEPDLDVIKIQVNVFLGKAKEFFSKSNDVTKDNIEKSEALHDSTAVKLFEEIKLMYSELPMKISKRITHEEKRTGLYKLNPNILDEILFSSRNRSTGFLIVLSILKNDFPWLFEAGNELIRATKRRNSIEVKNAVVDFRKLLEFTFEHPAMRYIFESTFELRYYRDYYHILMKYLERDYSDANLEVENFGNNEEKAL